MGTEPLTILAHDIRVRRAELSEIIDLRWRVLRTDQPRSTVIFAGDDAPDTVHVAAICDKLLVGCASLHRADLQGNAAWQLRGVAVEVAWRKQHVGQTMLDTLEAHVRSQGSTLLWANARLTAINFYRRLGWEIISEPFDIPIAGPHVRIRRDLVAE